MQHWHVCRQPCSGAVCPAHLHPSWRSAAKLVGILQLTVVLCPSSNLTPAPSRRTCVHIQPPPTHTRAHAPPPKNTHPCPPPPNTHTSAPQSCPGGPSVARSCSTPGTACSRCTPGTEPGQHPHRTLWNAGRQGGKGEGGGGVAGFAVHGCVCVMCVRRGGEGGRHGAEN